MHEPEESEKGEAEEDLRAAKGFRKIFQFCRRLLRHKALHVSLPSLQ